MCFSPKLLILRTRLIITSLLSQIPSIFSHIKNPESALLPSLDAALSALQATGGKIVAAVSSLPIWGPGQLSMREDPKIHGTDAERKLFTTENAAWKKTASKLAEAGVGVDLFVASPGGVYMDVATIGMFARGDMLFALSGPNFVPRPRLESYWW